jgi:hypothetical protein
MKFKSADHLIRKLAVMDKVAASKELTEFYTHARFKISKDCFLRQFTDGSNDGGIDFFNQEDSTYFIFQSKFAGAPKRVSASEILGELRKLKNTLITENPNQAAREFVNSIKRDVGNRAAVLEVLWLTTNIVDAAVRDEVQRDLVSWRKKNRLAMGVDFVAIDKHALDSVIYDVKHGYVPYTGKKVLKLEEGQWMEESWEETNVYSLVCTVEVNEILKWFRSADQVTNYLQKNVRDFLGLKKINRAIAKSYVDAPHWFWYKHNGIIIFADNLSIDHSTGELTLRNPQVVNGGQTLSALYAAYDNEGRRDNPAKVLVRVYRLPYENTETYQRSIEIISALNSQNAIEASDLRSTDPRQVRLEQLLREVGDGYGYIRKRSADAKASLYNVSMKHLALVYQVCKRSAPHEGVRGNVEELFEEPTKYNEIFNEREINKELGSGHVVLNYITAWVIHNRLTQIRGDIPQRDEEFWQFTRWFVLADVYGKIREWRQKCFDAGFREWSDFLLSYQFENALAKYARTAFKIAREILPKREMANPKDFYRKTDSFSKLSARTGTRQFNSLFSRAFTRFGDDNMPP